MSSVRQTQRGGRDGIKKKSKSTNAEEDRLLFQAAVSESRTQRLGLILSRCCIKKPDKRVFSGHFFFYPAPFLVHHSIRSEINSDTPSFLCQFQSSLSHFAPVDFHFLVFFCLSVVDVRKTAAILVLFLFGCTLCRFLFILCMFFRGLRGEKDFLWRRRRSSKFVGHFLELCVGRGKSILLSTRDSHLRDNLFWYFLLFYRDSVLFRGLS